MTPTQERILSMLPASIAQIKSALGKSERAVYRHLTPLHKAGIIWYVNGRMVERAGKVATWTSAAQPTTN